MNVEFLIKRALWLLLQAWLGAAVVASAFQVLAHIYLALAPASTADIGRRSMSIYQRYTKPNEDRQWFSLGDILHRYSLSLLCFAWNLLTQPINFLSYTIKHSQVNYGRYFGWLFVIWYPVMPLWLMVYELIEIILAMFKADVIDDSPGKVFFIPPKGLIHQFMWKVYSRQSLYVAQFFICGTDAQAIETTWQDDLLTKEFWRRELKKVGACVPQTIGEWDGEKLTLGEGFDLQQERKMIIKLVDAYLGIGDKVFETATRIRDAEEYLKSNPDYKYQGTKALLLDFIKPAPELEVHSFDIVTILQPDGEIGVTQCLLWKDCEGPTSHSTTSGYSFDYLEGKVSQCVNHYSYHFSQKQNSEFLGTKIKGVARAVEQAKQCHKNISRQHPWVTVIGWDAMVTDCQTGDTVFFEGNFAGYRFPRQVFIDYFNFVDFITHFFWPFDNKYNIQPGITTNKFDSKKE